MAWDGPAEFYNWHPIYNCEVYIIGAQARKYFLKKPAEQLRAVWASLKSYSVLVWVGCMVGGSIGLYETRRMLAASRFGPLTSKMVYSGYINVPDQGNILRAQDCPWF